MSKHLKKKGRPTTACIYTYLRFAYPQQKPRTPQCMAKPLHSTATLALFLSSREYLASSKGLTASYKHTARYNLLLWRPTKPKPFKPIPMAPPDRMPTSRRETFREEEVLHDPYLMSSPAISH